MQLRRVNLSFTRAMVRALDARDNWTANHSTAVAAYSRDICRELQWDAEICERVHLVGMVHDVGKIAVPSEILQKTSALTDDEWALMREHSAEGEKILREVEGYDDIATVVRSHHERWDGAGYPDRIAGEQIPVLARVIAVADSYNAMTTARPYRGPMTPEEAIDQLVRGKGTQFESHMVDAFIAVLDRSDAGLPAGDAVQGLRGCGRRARRTGRGRAGSRPARHRRLSPAGRLPITVRQCLRFNSCRSWPGPPRRCPTRERLPALSSGCSSRCLLRRGSNAISASPTAPSRSCGWNRPGLSRRRLWRFWQSV